MTWSYDPSQLGVDSPAGLRNEVRLLVADTDSDEELIQDEEIDYLVAKWHPVHGTVEYCAAIVADVIANSFAKEVGYNADGVSIDISRVINQYRELAAQLREQHKQLTTMGGGPDMGGALLGDRRHPNLKNFSFGTQMHDNMEAGQQDWGNRDMHTLTEEEQLY